MANSSSLVQNVKAKNDDNVTKKFPYKILNDLAKKLKAAEDKISKMLAELVSSPRMKGLATHS